MNGKKDSAAIPAAIEASSQLGHAALKPAIVLVRPEIPENLGFIARTLQCFAWLDLRLVGAHSQLLREESPAWKTASGADALLHSCRQVDQLADALGDCHEVWGFSRRPHGHGKHLNLQQALRDYAARRNLNDTHRVAWVFGPESQGLTGEDAPHIQQWVSIETLHPTMSLNLSHAIAIAVATWNQLWNNSGEAAGETPQVGGEETQIANRELMLRGWKLLETALRERQVYPASKEDAQITHARELWNRLLLEQGEAEFLVGMIKVVLQGRQPRSSHN